MSIEANWYAETGGVRKTRYKELGYIKSPATPTFWQHVAHNDDGTVSHVGPQYPSEKQLLADHENYAAFYGCDGAKSPEQPHCGGSEVNQVECGHCA